MFAAEAERGGIVAVAHGDGVRELAARGDGAREHVDEGVPALHAALPDVDEGGELVPVAAEQRQVDDVAAVQHDDRLTEGGGHRVEQGAFLVGEVIAALFELVFAVLARGAAEDDQGDLALARGALREHAGNRHLGIVQRPMPPPAVVRGVVRLGAPAAVGLQQVGVLHQPPVRDRLGDRLRGADFIGRVNVSPAAVPDIKIIELTAPEHRHARAAAQGEGAVVFEQNDAVGRRLAQQRRHRGRHGRSAGRLRLLLHQPVAHRLVHDKASHLAEEFTDRTHATLSPFVEAAGCGRKYGIAPLISFLLYQSNGKIASAARKFSLAMQDPHKKCAHRQFLPMRTGEGTPKRRRRGGRPKAPCRPLGGV